MSIGSHAAVGPCQRLTALRVLPSAAMPLKGLDDLREPSGQSRAAFPAPLTSNAVVNDQCYYPAPSGPPSRTLDNNHKARVLWSWRLPVILHNRLFICHPLRVSFRGFRLILGLMIINIPISLFHPRGRTGDDGLRSKAASEKRATLLAVQPVLVSTPPIQGVGANAHHECMPA